MLNHLEIIGSLGTKIFMLSSEGHEETEERNFNMRKKNCRADNGES